MSCTVNVVPMSAPRITPSVWRNVMRPAATKPISMSVVAAEDWMIAEMGGVVGAREPRGLRDRQRAVVDAEPPERVERDAQQMAEVDADHAAVGDDQHVVAVPMAGADPLDGAPHPGRDLRERFATGRRAIERRADPRVVRVPVEGADLVHRASLPLPE